MSYNYKILIPPRLGLFKLTIHRHYVMTIACLSCVIRLNTYHAAGHWSYHATLFLVFQKKIKFQRQFHLLLNQYQACLYLFECIFQDKSKYSNEVK